MAAVSIAFPDVRRAIWRSSTRPAQVGLGIANIVDGVMTEGLHTTGPEDFLSGVLVTLGLVLLAGSSRAAPWIDYGLNCFVRAITAAVWLGMTIPLFRCSQIPPLLAMWGVGVTTIATWLFVRSDWNRPGA